MAQLHLCEEDVTEPEMINKTLSTFPSAAALLAQMYRTMRFRTYSELTTFLLLAEKQQQLLLKNNKNKPPREANAAKILTRRPKGSWKSNQLKPHRPYHTEPNDKSSNQSSDSRSSSQSRSDTRKCHKCGRTGHLQKDCRTGECKKCGHPGHLARDCKTNEYHRCGRTGHGSRDCWVGAYVEKMYKELQELRKGQRELHSLDAPSLDGTDTENYMTTIEALPIVMSTYSPLEADRDIALLDSGSTHTILQDPRYFEFSRPDFEMWRHDPTASRPNSEGWDTCELSTIVGKRTLTFREGRARIMLSGGSTLICTQAMFALDAQQSLISFRNLRSHGIHALTAIREGEETLELRQGQKCLATARCEASGLYEIPISCPTRGHQTMHPTSGSAYSVTIPDKTKLWRG